MSVDGFPGGWPCVSMARKRVRDKISPLTNADEKLFTAATDSELLAAVTARSTAAMAELHERYGDAMYCLAVAIVGNHHAERVVHAALLAIWRQPARPATDATVRQVPVPCHLLDAVMSESAEIQEPDTTVRRERLGQLDPAVRTAVLLVIAGASRDQAAAALGEPIATVDRMLRTGLGLLGSPGSAGDLA